MFAMGDLTGSGKSFILSGTGWGKKPLYYWLKDGNLVFASELKPILKFPGFAGIAKRKSFPVFFTSSICASRYHFLRTSKRCVRRSSGLFGEVKQVEISELRRKSEGKRKQPVESYGQAKEELKEILRGAVGEECFGRAGGNLFERRTMIPHSRYGSGRVTVRANR